MHRPTVRFAVLTLVLALSPAVAQPMERAVLVVEGADDAAFAETVRALEAAGARLPHRFPPELAIGALPAGIESAIELPEGVRLRVERPGGPALAGRLPRSLGAARAFALGGRDVPPGLPDPTPLAGDHVEPLPGERGGVAGALPAGECGPHPPATSAYLAGHVAIGILLPESDAASPDTESWATEDPRFPGQDRLDLVVAEIVEGCDTLVTQIPQSGLSFSYDVRRAIPIPQEPILIEVNQRNRWIDPVLEAIGHGSGSSSWGTHGYLNALRDRFGSDWAAAAYVADDLNDADNGFPPTGFPFAYALLGGPYMVMTYDNDGWGIGRMDVVFRHELGHVFHALDEYRSAGNSCGATAGVLGVKNGNNDSPPGDPACETAISCVMRANSVPDACAFSLGQMGIRDTDGDGVLDPRDAPPDTGFALESPVLLTMPDANLVARASGTPRADERGFVPSGASVNRITGAEMSLDGAPYAPLAAADGAFGDRCEDLDVALTGLPEGWHVVRVRATNDVGILEPTPAEIRLYVNTDCADDAAEPDDDAATAMPRPVGTHPGYHCAFDPDWSRFRLQAGADVTLVLRQADTGGSLRLRLLDDGLREIAAADAVAGVAAINATASRTAVHHAIVEGDAEFETAYDLQLVADCLDDPDEPAPLSLTSTGTLRQRVICAADEDRYLVAVQAGESLQVDVTFDGALGDLDLDLLDPSGASVDMSVGTGSAETVGSTPTVEGVYVLRVFGKGPTDQGIYDVALTATGCIDDGRENDDDLATAQAIDAGSVVRGVICGDDEDWHAFDVTGRRLVRVLLDHDPTAGNLDLELWTDGGRLVSRSTQPGGSEVISSERLRPGAYRARVVGTGGARVTYTLHVENEDPLLLFLRKDPSDAILGWNLSSQECFLYRRSTNPADFSGAVREIVNEGDPSVPDGDRPIGDLLKRDRGVIGDGASLYCYLIDPHDCGSSLVGSVKIAEPYPVVLPGIGSAPFIDYTIVVSNGGVDDAYNVTVLDDIPEQGVSFMVNEIPPGATDASAAPPAGAHGRGLITVTGIDVPAGEERLVKFRIMTSLNTTIENPVVSNQARIVTAGVVPGGPGDDWLTDDGLTSAFPDDTRLYMARYDRQVSVHAFWHREVDVDLRVTDPCGNVLGEHDLLNATCGAVSGFVARASSCAAPGWPGRYEQVRFSAWPAPGTYVVEVAYPGALPDDAACGGTGIEEVTVVYQSPTILSQWRTVTIAPGETGVAVFSITE